MSISNVVNINVIGVVERYLEEMFSKEITRLQNLVDENPVHPGVDQTDNRIRLELIRSLESMRSSIN